MALIPYVDGPLTDGYGECPEDGLSLPSPLSPPTVTGTPSVHGGLLEHLSFLETRSRRAR